MDGAPHSLLPAHTFLEEAAKVAHETVASSHGVDRRDRCCRAVPYFTRNTADGALTTQGDDEIYPERLSPRGNRVTDTA